MYFRVKYVGNVCGNMQFVLLCLTCLNDWYYVAANGVYVCMCGKGNVANVEHEDIREIYCT